MKKRSFIELLSKLKQGINGYDYYTNFEKVYENTEQFKEEIDILNSLIGSKNIENDFLDLINKHPKVLRAIPILLAVRERRIFCKDKKGEFLYDFQNKNLSDDQYLYFMKETGLLNLFANRLKSNLYDYVLGVNAGLDSNARKNRGGHLMEKLVEYFIELAGFIEGKNYFKQMTTKELEKKFNIDLSCLSAGLKKAIKKFDFVVKIGDMIYVIETNFYSTNGSKLNETARSYKMLAQELAHIKNIRFVWITDGMGWLKSKDNLEETFDIMEHVYNIDDLENGIIERGFER